MERGYHLRFLKVDDMPRSIDAADIVRVSSAHDGAQGYGVQLHALSIPPPRGDDVVLRLVRQTDESEAAFVHRAFAAAARQQPPA